ncbi:NAD-dependent epimerase/dehydratase family protein [Paenibacillus abyssi]|uniref:Nucleoside-diphosphate sugar epimerase n=1 Tax=Paenibacillus abyssi TaxID=1340531 RepID=A0A917CMW7_9BACL|nr:NAD-dependent epimerase/dehydratase family protein [Paenibacillus abyssi]GGF92520.1 nucleoside-diphosphate sugar epimerase [Paenibacillus abyssi]
MKVLVTGGYGFIGSFVAERFFKEGYDVYIIDNRPSGKPEYIDFKHKAYNLSVEDRKCEEIFRTNQFDAVIHLAAQVSVHTSMENPRLDTESNVLGLSNMLSMSGKYGVKKFIFASSAAVYGPIDQCPLPETAPCNPISPYGMNKWVGEIYCRKWEEIYGLESIIFRFSNVYGPRQGTGGDGGVVSAFMEKIVRKEPLTIHGDGNQTRDFIYVQDVADAIYRASYSTITGIYNLSTGKESSINDLVQHLSDLNFSPTIQYQEKRPGDINRSMLDNTLIKKHLDWVPMFDLKEGLQRTVQWHEQRETLNAAAPSVQPKRTSSIHKYIKTIVPYLENLILFLLVAWLTMNEYDASYAYLDFKLIYIIILGMLYGNRQAIIAFALSTGLYVYYQLHNGSDVVSLLYDTDFFFQVSIYLFIALIVGYTIERKTALIRTRETQLATLEEKHSFLSEVYQETRLIKNELQQQIMNNGDSFGKIYAVTKELESLEPDHIFTATVSVVESIMKSSSVTIYTVNSYHSYLRLVAHSKGEQLEAFKSIKVEDTPYLHSVLHEKKLFVNKNLQHGAPLLCAPVVSNGETVAMISLHDMSFEHFTLYYQNLFKVTVDLVSSALSRAYSYVEASSSQRYIQGTSILTTDVFTHILAGKKVAKAKHDIDYVLLQGSGMNAAAGQLSEVVSRSLRETDYVGLDNNGNITVLLSNSSINDASFVLERFAKVGIHLQVMKEDVSYA